MADTMQFDLVTPERMLGSMAAESATIPGAEGDMTAYPQHMPLITTLRPGVVTATGADGAVDFVVSGGFAEIGPEGVSVLAERAMPREEVTREFMAEILSAAEAFREEATGPQLDLANKTVADILALSEALGVPAS
ncbi:MAG: ATP synthase F1 subunit epsilon [Alphaproteobacteria bacterium]|nr:MAG: ATP synthase F1 subunit epsilon [Alphaproteobacteria bacterium]